MKKNILWSGPPDRTELTELSQLGWNVYTDDWNKYTKGSPTAFGRILMTEIRLRDPSVVIIDKGRSGAWHISCNDLHMIQDAEIGVVIIDTSSANDLAGLVSSGMVECCDILLVSAIETKTYLKRFTYADILEWKPTGVLLQTACVSAYAKRKAARLPSCCKDKDRLH